MATATKKSRVAGRLPGRAREVRVSDSVEFLVFEDNGGEYYWTIVTGDGAPLVRSGGFGSYEGAERAARQVRDGAASARLEHRAAGAPPDALAGGRAATRDDADAERWLDEGGSFSGEAVGR